jgi:hypothetical protein
VPHDTPLIAAIAIVFALASVFGLIAQRLKVPPIVGYLVVIDTRRLDQHVTTIDKETFERIRKAVKDIL